ncbi:MAG: CRTAC1 family protein [Hoeflea sp.]|uniref:CRTAC1 family protein n=1 Tax=Hoeflea sp. TaxID=1940281 RepID=UPI001D5BB1F2|nr:CRTAC1 family protein [Hoeflea sp.]MBU4529092.1 CRTAC1 family protein [Alphaproteobacteria bacterium]MBU4543497.1 CRTAC1 family protein [Alphaproteobacteria bacterium]MBU4549122.1 CRTAC1 family protein [Alphaproteobacteria bacterium]MBV1725257.1 CRTAC1 family protein [Hoeflea sp.]MBV1785218.1 CRTAC1 family protein [Hoeflea sp.]
MKRVRSLSCTVGLLLSAFVYPAIAETTFTSDVPILNEEAASAGIDHSYTGGWEFFVGGGVASFDCNGDRLPDLVIAGGASPAGFYVNESATGGALAFKPLDTGLDAEDLTGVLGAYPVDIDNDRHMDLVLLKLGRNLVLKGGPDCTFEKANRSFEIDGGRAWSTSMSAIWERNSRFPTIAIGNYVDRSAPGTPFGTCEPNQLLRSRPGEAPDYSEPLTLEPGYCALSMLFTDWNRSGQPDLRITNDRQYYREGQEQLWQMSEGRPPRLYSASQGWQRLTIWGMGIAETDFDADGLPEYALTSMGDTKLQKLDEEAGEDRPTYRDIAFEKGVTAQRPYTGGDHKPSTGWHSQFADINNDTLTDLFIAKGNVQSMPDFASFDPDNLLLGGFDDSFHEKGLEAGIALDTRGRGAVVEDFNMDGMLDLLVVNREHPASLFRNLGAKTDWGHRPLGNWVKIELDNGKINPNAVGALISVRTGTRTQTRRIQVGGGHASGRAGFVHVGVGVSERATIRVQWPDGEWSHPYRVFANQHVRIIRGEANARYWYPAAQ